LARQQAQPFERNGRLRRGGGEDQERNEQEPVAAPHGGILSAPSCEGIQLILHRLPVFWLAAFYSSAFSRQQGGGNAAWISDRLHSGATARELHPLP
jgi:hypothetical protein